MTILTEFLPNLANYKLILGSQSPRRKELLAGLDLDFEVRVLPDIDESYPETLPADEVPAYISEKKAAAYLGSLAEDELLITADTIVWTYETIIGKPKSREDAIAMLELLAGKDHEVITGVCLTTRKKTVTFSAGSIVHFAPLEKAEIEYYVDKYKPFDKAGSYGIQEWIGYVGVESIKGSFYNVMGLPVRKLYEQLRKF